MFQGRIINFIKEESDLQREQELRLRCGPRTLPLPEVRDRLQELHEPPETTDTIFLGR